MQAQPYTLTTPVTGLQYPVAFTFLPDGRYLITLKSGVIRMHDANGAFMNNFYNLSDSTYDDFERGLLGIEIDPDFANNRYVYAYYNHRCCVSTSQTGPQFLRVVRFTEAANVGTNPTLIMNISVSNSIPGNHVGGNIRFRPSEPNQIYVGIGELATPSNAEVLTNPFGKFLRLNKDGSIPTDNPFYDDGNPATGNDDRIWSYGHRNQFDFTFGPNDSLYSTENGASSWDEVNIVTRGKNYGWQDCEGNYVYGSSTTLCQTNFPTHEEPIYNFPPPLPAVTGILYYSGNVMPEFDNHLLVADNDRGYITDLTLAGPPYTSVTSGVLFQDLVSLTTIKQGSDGCIYAMKGGYTTTGNITRICPQGLSVTENTGGAMLSTVPNPFNETAQVNYSLDKKAHVVMTIHDITGRKIAELVNEEKAAGNYSSEVNAAELSLPAGTYFCRMELNSGEVMKTLKLILMK